MITTYGVYEVAKWCGVTPSAVCNWMERHTGYPPPTIRIVSGKRVVYGWNSEQKPYWRQWVAEMHKR